MPTTTSREVCPSADSHPPQRKTTKRATMITTPRRVPVKSGDAEALARHAGEAPVHPSLPTLCPPLLCPSPHRHSTSNTTSKSHRLRLPSVRLQARSTSINRSHHRPSTTRPLLPTGSSSSTINNIMDSSKARRIPGCTAAT